MGRVAWVSLIAAQLIGCGQSGPSTPPPSEGQKRLAQLVGVYLRAQQEPKPPRNDKEFAAYLKKIAADPALTVSPDDREPFVLIHGLDVKGGFAVPPIVAHERKGTGGKKWAADLMGTVHALTDDELKKRIP